MSAPYRSIMPASAPADHPVAGATPRAAPAAPPDYPTPRADDAPPSITCNVPEGSATATLNGESLTARLNPDGSYMTTVQGKHNGVVHTHSETGGMPGHDEMAGAGSALLSECGIDHYSPVLSPQQAGRMPPARGHQASRLRAPAPGG